MSRKSTSGLRFLLTASQSTAELILLPVPENGTPPYWNSISGFDFGVCAVIGVSFYIRLPNFVVFGRSTAELWHHIRFSRWRPYSRKCTSGFRFNYGVCLRRWKAICMPNFDEISQCPSDITLFSISENGRPPYWNSISGFDFDQCVVIGIPLCICLPNFVVIGWSSAELWRHRRSQGVQIYRGKL